MKRQRKRPIALLLAFAMMITSFFGGMPAVKAYAEEKQWAQLKSGANDGNGHFTDDTSKTPEAFVLSQRNDFTDEEVSFKMKLASTGTSRFRFVNKYVDNNNWSYLAYDGASTGSWIYEYKYDGNTDYSTVANLPTVAPYDEVEVSISYNDTGMSITVDNKTTDQKQTVNKEDASIVGLKSVSGNVGFGAGTFGQDYTNLFFTDVKVGEAELNNFSTDFKPHRENVEGQVFTTVDESATMQPETPPSGGETPEGGETPPGGGETPGGNLPPEEPTGEGRVWRKIVGGDNNGGGHEYGDGTKVGPITLLDMSKTTSAGTTLSLVVKPNENFGIFYNYVDSANWFYVGYDSSSKWYYEYKINGSGQYATISNSIPAPVKGEEVDLSISVDRESLTVTIGGELVRVQNQNFFDYAEANGNRGRIGVMSKLKGEENALYFADVMYNGDNCMEDSWQFAANRAGQVKEKYYTALASVAGKVVDKESGLPLANATVRIGLSSAVTDEQGIFSFEKIEVGTHTVTATKPGYEAFEQEIEVADTGLSDISLQLVPKAPLQLSEYDVIESENMKVYVGKEFPLVARYEMKGINAFFRGNETKLDTIKINGTDIKPEITTQTSENSLGDSKTYLLTIKDEEKSLDFTMTVVISVKENTLTWQVTNLEKKDGCAKIATIEIPGHNLLSVDAQEEEAVFAGAQASEVTTEKADYYISFKEDGGFKPSDSNGYLYGFLSNGNLSAGLFSNSEVEGDKRVIRTNGADSMGLSSAVWYYELGDKNGQAQASKYPDYPLSELPIAKVAIGADENKDGEIDWNDGALAFRKIMNIPYGSEVIKEQVNNRIVMNFASMAPNPFLATADNIKKVYLATDGLPQAVMLKGYGNEGHDSANSEYADVAERLGGIEDFQKLIKIAHDYNTEIGIHVNAQEIYPEAKSMNNAMVGSPVGNGWGWLDQAHTIDKLWDLSTQARWKRFVQLYDRINNTDHYTLDWPEAVVESRGEVVTSKEDIKKEAESLPDNMDFIYLDVWYQNSWETRRIAEEINSLGWRFSTEFSSQGEYDSTWQHWSTDAPYGGKDRKGFNSDIIRFIRNDQRDSQVLNHPAYGGTADNPLLGGYRLYGFEGWQGDRDFNNYIKQTFNQNLPTKFLQHYYVTEWTNYDPAEERPAQNTEKEIKLQNDQGDKVVVTRKENKRTDDNIERIITLNGKVVLDEVKYLLPWTDSETKEVKLYHWNLDGGESTWQLTSGFEGLSNVVAYKLTDQGRTEKTIVPVVNGEITLVAEPATAYVLVKEEGVKEIKNDFGEGDYVVDPGFNGYAEGSSLDPVDWKGDVDAFSVKVEKSLTGDQRLAFNSPEGRVAVNTQIRNLKEGEHYVAEVYVQNDSTAKAYIGVNTKNNYVENYTEQSVLDNYVGCDNKNRTKMQRIQISFVAESDTATLVLMRDAGSGNTYMDDIRIVQKELDNFQADGSFKQDFETVVQGLYPFVLSYAQGYTDPQTHLSQRNGEFTQAGWNGRVIDDVIDGEWSLKQHNDGTGNDNTGVIYQTLPQNFRFEPGKVYTVEFDYQSGPDKAFAMIVGDGIYFNTPTQDQYLAQARGSANTKHHVMTVTGSGTGQTWIGLYQDGTKTGNGAMGQKDFVLDNLVIRENKEAVNVTLDKTTIYLGETAKIHGSNLEEIIWESSDSSIAVVNKAHQRVEVLKKGNVTLTATLPNGEIVTFEITVMDKKVVEIPRTEYDGITVSANTEETTHEQGHAQNAVDGQTATQWHSNYSNGQYVVGENKPAILTVDFGKEIEFGGFKFLQRASGDNGIIGKYSYKILAEDNTTVLTEGSKVLTESEKRNATWVVNEFDTLVKGRFLVITITEGGNGFAAIAEIVPFVVHALDRLSIAGELSKTYDGTAVSSENLVVAKGEKEKDSEVVFTYSKVGADGEVLTEAPKNAGSYYVKASVTLSDNEIVESNQLSFAINKKEISLKNVVLEWFVEEGSEPVLGINSMKLDGVVEGESLEEGVDYTTTIEKVKVAGTTKAIVTVALNNTEKAANYHLKINTYEEVLETEEETEQEDIWVSGLEDKLYTGSKITQTIQVFDGDQLLIENVDYTISYKNNINAYEYTDEDLEKYEEAYKIDPKKTKGAGEFVAAKAPQVVLKMKGNYTGTKSLFFRIERADIEETSGDEYVFAIDNLVVVGNKKKQSPAPSVLWSKTGKTLKNNKDFTVKEYLEKKEFSSVGTYDLTVEGKGNFTGTRHITLQIVDSKNVVPMSKVTVKGVKALDYTGEEVMQKVEELKVTYKNTPLEAGKDFTVDYENNIAAGTASIILTANGTTKDEMTFIGTKRITFKINGYNMAKVKATGLVSQVFTGYEIDPLAEADQSGNPVVTLTIPKTGNLPEKTLTAENYFATFEKNVAKGTATVILTGRPESGVTGTKKLTFKITAAPLSDAELSGYRFSIAYDEGTTVYYTKGGAKPVVTVANAHIPMIEGRDYTLTYKNNKKLGTAQVEIKGKGNYTGTVKKDFEIVAKPVSAEDGNGVWVVVNDKAFNEKTKKNSWKQSFKVWDSDGKALAAADAKLKDAEYTVYGLPADYAGTLKVGDPLGEKDVVPVGGKVQIKVAMSGNYTGEVVGVYSIIEKSRDISKATIQMKPQQYTGKPVFIDSDSDFKTKTLNGVTLTMEGEGKNIEIVEGSYINNVKMGTAKVTIRGVGEYGGIKTVTFKIGGRSVIDWLKTIFYNG